MLTLLFRIWQAVMALTFKLSAFAAALAELKTGQARIVEALRENTAAYNALADRMEQVIELLNPGPAVGFTFTVHRDDGTTQNEVEMLTIRDDQKVTLSIAPVDAKGKPAVLDGVPVWAGSDDTVFTVEAAADGLSAELFAASPNPKDSDGNPIPARVVVTADADLGSGTTPLTGSLDVVVTGGQAVSLTITAAPPANQ